MTQKIKVVVHVPESHADAIRQAIGDAKGGKVGNYSYCSFSIKGTGRFLPEDGARPTIGHVGQRGEVVEERIEITTTLENMDNVIKAIKASHPYEEPTIDVYSLINHA